MTFRGNDEPCPYCGAPNDAATAADGGSALPVAGNWSVCFGCGGVAVFTGVGLGVRPPSFGEQLAIAADQDLQQILRIRQAYLA